MQLFEEHFLYLMSNLIISGKKEYRGALQFSCSLQDIWWWEKIFGLQVGGY